MDYLHLKCKGWQSNAIIHYIPPKGTTKTAQGTVCPLRVTSLQQHLVQPRKGRAECTIKRTKCTETKNVYLQTIESTTWNPSPLQNMFNIHFSMIQALGIAALPCSTPNKGTEKSETDSQPWLGNFIQSAVSPTPNFTDTESLLGKQMLLLNN